MFPCVPGELVRPRKLPATALVVADIGLLASVGPEVGLEVGGLCVRFQAALVGAVVDHLLPLGPGSLLPGLDHLLLGDGGRGDLGEVDGKV